MKGKKKINKFHSRLFTSGQAVEINFGRGENNNNRGRKATIRKCTLAIEEEIIWDNK